MKKIVFLSLLLVLCTVCVAAVEVDFTIKPVFSDGYYCYDYEYCCFVPGVISSIEVGVSVMPQLDLVGKMGWVSNYYKEKDYDDQSWLVVVPGLGARYTFWENNNLDAYAFSTYSFLVSRYDGESNNTKLGSLDLGLGGVCKLNENCGLIGETGVQRLHYKNSYWEDEETCWISTGSVGVRFYF